MKEGYSLWSWNTEWHSYWNGSQLFLLITQDSDGGFVNYAAYGYDFETQSRVTNQMILDQMGISNEVYLTNLKEKVQLMFEDMSRSIPEDLREEWGYDELLEKTLNWADLDQPIFINGSLKSHPLQEQSGIIISPRLFHMAECLPNTVRIN